MSLFMFLFLLSDREGKKTLNSVYSREEILQYCTKRNFLVELGLPVFES